MSEDPRAVLDVRTPEPAATLRYGERADQVADLFLAGAAEPAVLVILLHGGFWRDEFDRAHLRALAGALAGAGAHVVTPEFHRTGRASGGWPGTFHDIAAAADTLPGLVEAAGHTVASVVLAGHSSGGHLALWAAGRHRLPPDAPGHRIGRPPVDRVVALAPVAVLAGADRLGGGPADRTAIADLLGGGPAEVPDRYAAADPVRLLPLGVPVTLLHGDRDDRVPVEFSREFARRAAAAGDRVAVRELPGMGHFAPIAPDSAAWPTVRAALLPGR